MDSLFAPWRYPYLVSEKSAGGCVFCAALRGEGIEENLVVYRARLNFVILNLYPYNNGHLMIVPNDHVPSPASSSPEQRAEMTELAVAVEEILRETHCPDGFNLGMNLGRAAGAGIEQHYHLHIVPRWSGDTNFMAVTAGTRVIPEDLISLQQRLRTRFVARLGPDSAPEPGREAGEAGPGS